MSKGAVLFPGLYMQAWLEARATRPRHKALSDELFWHDAYNFYAEKQPRLTADAESLLIRLWQDRGDEVARAHLLEAFYYIVRPIAGKIATKRFPPALFPSQKVRGKRNIAKDAYDGQRDRIHELASVGIFGLLVAANRFNPALGFRFSTHANDWVDKYIRLYCEELVSVVPRNDPERRVMDLIEAALDGRRLYRGQAAGGMAVFDAGLLIDGVETEDGSTLPDFDYLSTEGPTREYLQRRVGEGGSRFLWKDQGSEACPRLSMPISREVTAPWDKPNPLDDVEFTRGVRDVRTVPRGPRLLQAPQPAEVCYLAKQRPDRQYGSWQSFGVSEVIFKSKYKARTPQDHWAAEFEQHLAQQKLLNPQNGDQAH